MNPGKTKKRALSLVLVAALLLAADLMQPGWGKFPNPVFWTRFAANAAKDKFSNADAVNLNDARLMDCKTPSAAPVAITNAQAAARKTLEGKSSVIAVQTLGTPACELANGSYRWLLESGLALDVDINEGGIIDAASLSR